MIKVAIVQRRIMQFRVPFFERLAHTDGIDLTVFDTGANNENGFNFKTKKYYLKTRQYGSLQLNFSHGLFSQLLKNKYDVVVFEGSVYNLSFLIYIPILRLFKKKVCWWSIGFEPYNVGKMLRMVRNCLYRLGSNMSDSIIAYHEKSKDYYLCLGNDPKKIHIAWNVFDDKSLLDAEAKIKREDLNNLIERFGLKNKNIFLYVGKIEETKRLGTLIKAFGGLLRTRAQNDIALLVIGDGNEKDKWQTYIKDKNIKDVIFAGEINNLSELAKIFKIGTIFVMPGTGGMAIYQAMVYGLPVVVSSPDGVDTNLLIDNETGFYFRFDDPEDLAQKLSALLNKGHVYLTEIGAKARQKALGEFPMSRMVNGFCDAVLHGKSRAKLDLMR